MLINQNKFTPVQNFGAKAPSARCFRTALSKYRSDVNQIKWGDVDKEKLLSRAIQATIPLNTRVDYNDLTVDARKAADELVESNLHLSVAIAQKYARKGFPCDDLIQEGNLGLMEAAVRFNPDRGNKFSTYAEWWIRKKILHYISDKSRTIKIPVHTLEAINRVKKAESALKARVVDESNENELTEMMQMNPQELEKLLELYVEEPISLDTLVGIYKDLPLCETVCDPEESTPKAIQRFEFSGINTAIKRVFAKLDQREARVLNSYFGLNGGKVLTQQEISLQEEVSRERIKQLIQRALLKIRMSSRSEELRVFHESNS